MRNIKRATGIDVIGNVPWGTHFCLFYKTAEDIIEMITPYIQAGLAGNEFCICVASEPLTAKVLEAKLAEYIPGFAEYSKNGQIEIVPYSEWYLEDNIFNPERVLNAWMEKLNSALAMGFSGLRIAGNTFWLEKQTWDDFMRYERTIDNVIGKNKMLAMCLYSIEKCGAGEILNIASTHEFAIARSDGMWKAIGNYEIEAKTALRKSQIRYRLLFENMLDGYAYCKMIYDDNGFPIDYVYIYTNNAFRRLTGLNNIAGKKATEAIPGIKQSHPELLNIYSRVASTGKTEIFEIKFKPLAVWLSIRAYSTERGYFVTIFENITERKLMEEALKESKLQAELYLDLMGHDINNLNQIALGYLELADEMVKDKDIKELFSKSLDAINSSSRLIEKVMILQKVKNGRLETEQIDIIGLLAELQSQYTRIPNKDVTISFYPNEGCIVNANGLLRDVFSNLIINSIEHSDKLSIQISLDLKRVTYDGKEFYEVTIEDNGPGITDELKEKLFDRFHVGKSKPKGKGLDLYLIRSFLEKFNGKVWIEDRVQGDHTKGAKFVVLLPVAENN